MEPFKDIYNRTSVIKLAKDIKRVYRDFDEANFIKLCMRGLCDMEMKERVIHIANNLKKHLPRQYSKAVNIMVDSLAKQEFHKDQEWAGQNVAGVTGFMVWPLLTYIEHYGLDYFEISIFGMYEMTKRFSAEFAIRPFIERYNEQMFDVLITWTNDHSKHVRRLCSEGTRPNLPWGKRVSAINKDLSRNIALLERLKLDPEEYVQRSVANHLNDLSRIDRTLLISTLKRWQNPKLKVPLKIIRHASRTLLKEGLPEALLLHGYNSHAKINIKEFSISSSSVKEGDSIELTAQLLSRSLNKEKILLEYIVYYLKANGQHSRKIFRLKDFVMCPKEVTVISKRISFKRVTTRRHHAGLHRIALQINGIETEFREMKLLL